MANLSSIGLAVAVIVSVVALFATVPELGLILLVAGAVAGWDTAEDAQARLMLTALVLTGLSGQLSAIPAVGEHLAGIFGSLGVAAVGASIIVVAQTIVSRLKALASSSD